MSASAGTEAIDSRPSAAVAAGFFAGALVLRVLVAHWQWFWVQDDISIAAGVASLVTGEPAGLYRYGPQLGYYRFVEALVGLVGGGAAAVPRAMISVSAVAGAVVPVLGLHVFRRELAWRARLLLAFVLLANPILWASSRYGNSATIASAVVAASVVLLSNRPRRTGEVAALVLFAAGILLRADSVLLAPVVLLLLRRTHGSTGAAVMRVGVVAAAVGLVYVAAARFDPHMDDIVTTTGVHLFNDEFRTQFWEYVLWSFSPFVLLLAAWGWRDLLARRDPLLAVVTLWAVPVLAFYFGSSTTPRYTLLAVPPVSIAAVTGATRLFDELAARLPRAAATASAGALLFLHLVVGLGQFVPAKASNAFTEAAIFSHDGPQWTGGWLWHGIADAGRTLSRPRFASPYSDAVEAWLASPGAPRRVVYVSDGHPAVAFRYHALVRGARIVHRVPGPDDRMATTYEKDGVRVTVIDDRPWAMAPVATFELGPGDELWNMQPRPPASAMERIPEGLGLEPVDGPGGGIRAYRLVAGRGFR